MKKYKKMADFDLAIESAPEEQTEKAAEQYTTLTAIPANMAVIRLVGSSKALVIYGNMKLEENLKQLKESGFELVAPEDVAKLDNAAYVIAKITGSGGCVSCGK